MGTEYSNSIHSSANAVNMKPTNGFPSLFLNIFDYALVTLHTNWVIGIRFLNIGFKNSENPICLGIG